MHLMSIMSIAVGIGATLAYDIYERSMVPVLSCGQKQEWNGLNRSLEMRHALTLEATPFPSIVNSEDWRQAQKWKQLGDRP